MSLPSERTCWADVMGLTPEQVEALTLIAEESDRRGRVELDPRDVWSEWPRALRLAGREDLAERVEDIAIHGAR